MNAKQYLMQIKLADIRINNKIAEKQQLYSMATKVTSTWSQDKTGGNQATDKIGNMVAKIADIEAEINRMIDEYVDLKNRIIHQIEQIEDERYYNILHKRYVQYKDFSVIASDMCYEYKSIINLHGNALKEFSKIIDDIK